MHCLHQKHRAEISAVFDNRCTFNFNKVEQDGDQEFTSLEIIVLKVGSGVNLIIDIIYGVLRPWN